MDRFNRRIRYLGIAISVFIFFVFFMWPAWSADEYGFKLLFFGEKLWSIKGVWMWLLYIAMSLIGSIVTSIFLLFPFLFFYFPTGDYESLKEFGYWLKKGSMLAFYASILFLVALANAPISFEHSLIKFGIDSKGFGTDLPISRVFNAENYLILKQDTTGDPNAFRQDYSNSSLSDKQNNNLSFTLEEGEFTVETIGSSTPSDRYSDSKSALLGYYNGLTGSGKRTLYIIGWLILCSSVVILVLSKIIIFQAIVNSKKDE